MKNEKWRIENRRDLRERTGGNGKWKMKNGK
jgi:hypothetical protein